MNIAASIVLTAVFAAPAGPSFRFQPGQSFLIKLEFKTKGTFKGTPSAMTALYEAVVDISKDGEGSKLAIRFERFSKEMSAAGMPTMISLWSGVGLKQVQDGKLVRNIPGEKDERFEIFRRPLLELGMTARAEKIAPHVDPKVDLRNEIIYFFTSLMLALPVLPAKAGTTWSGERGVPPPSPNALQPPMKLKYAIEASDDKWVVIGFSGTREADDHPGKDSEGHVRDEVTGKTRFATAGAPALDTMYTIHTTAKLPDGKETDIAIRADLHITQTTSLTAASVAAGKVETSGGDGSSAEKAIVVQAPNDEAGVKAEYAWLKQRYPGCRPVKQHLFNDDQHNRIFDILDIETADGTKKSVYFEISSFKGKW